MALFVVRHQHEALRCPAKDPYMGAMLLNHMSRPNVRQHGIDIQSEAIIEGEHTLYMILESSDEDHVTEFMKPFAMVGSVNVYPASTCVRAVASGGCGFAMPMVDLVLARPGNMAAHGGRDGGETVESGAARDP